MSTQATDPETATVPRSDLVGGGAWVAFGCAILIASWRMDRLENQDVNPYTVPGLLPGLLGIAIMLMGSLLAVRGWRRGGLTLRAPTPHRPERSTRQVVLVLALCLVFGTVLVGHGLPFWAAASLFIAVAIIVLQHAANRAAGRRLDARAIATAIIIAIAAGTGITFLFQNIFLVHLP